MWKVPTTGPKYRNHNEFLVTSIDKANGNVAFIWQWFYVLVLIRDFGLEQNTTSLNKNYIQVNKTINQVISDHTTFLKHKFILEVDY